MKKILAVILILGILVGCSTTNENTDNKTYQVLVPKGAPALAVVNAMTDEREDAYTLVDGTDIITVELAKENSEYDVIIAPINIGAKLIQSGQSSYKLASILTWGNLYLVGTTESELTEPIAAFGELAVPGLVLEHIMKQSGMENEVTYYPSVSEAQVALLSGKSTLALLAEPSATATISKAKENGIELSIKADIQSMWEEISDTYGYPQAAIFIKESVYLEDTKALETYLNHLSTSTTAEIDLLTSSIETIGPQELGVPSTALAVNTYSRQNIRYVDAREVQTEIVEFLSIFHIDVTDTLYLK
ncbi:MAG: hypothetical protein IKL88_01555 [Erysipelotrichales bacterium]|nr:hypothetical protein [Erysipelotrichales bacterium]